MAPKTKNWLIGILSFVAGIVVTIIGFFILTIYVSFIQEHELQEQDEESEVFIPEHIIEPFYLPALNTRLCHSLAVSDIKEGGWWTDGDIYYKVISNAGDSIYMIGTTGEDSGMEILFRYENDTTLRTDGASCFATYNSLVTCNSITLADGSQVDLLVAYQDSDYLYPFSVLQRYNGRTSSLPSIDDFLH